MCFENYILRNEDATSKSGLYFTDLTGCTSSLLSDLQKENHADEAECFEYLYRKAQGNLSIDVHRKLGDRFHIDKKLLTRETSVFNDTDNSNTGLSGCEIKLTLPKYGKVQLLTISVKAASAVSGAEIKVYRKDSSGELLSTITTDLVAGLNTVSVMEDFEESELFVAYSPTSVPSKKSDNLYYPKEQANSINEDLLCSFPCVGGEGSVRQINGGGLNVKFVVYCSIDKFICDNLPIFKYALLYRLGVDTMKERITTPNVNVSTILTEDRAKELLALYNEEYQDALTVATSHVRIHEDPICFSCKRTITAKSNLP